jgi:uncharacterized protein (TIGR00369 family)
VSVENHRYLDLRKSHAHCLICGVLNPIGLRLGFSAQDGDGVSGLFTGQPQLQGYSGVLHGGVISSLLDAAMTHCLFHRGIEAVTAELLVRYIRPVAVGEPLELRARIVSESPPTYRLRSHLRQGGQIMAYARAKFVSRPRSAEKL